MVGEECSRQREQPARGPSIQRDPGVWRKGQKFSEGSRGQGGKARGVDQGKGSVQKRRAFILRTPGGLWAGQWHHHICILDPSLHSVGRDVEQMAHSSSEGPGLVTVTVGRRELMTSRVVWEVRWL